MFTQVEYFIGWLAYGIAAVGGLWCWWTMLCAFRLRAVAPLLTLVMGFFLMAPWPVAEGSPFWGPAWLISASEGLFDGSSHYWRAGKPLLFIVGGGTVLGLIAQIVASMLAGETKPARRATARAHTKAS